MPTFDKVPENGKTPKEIDHKEHPPKPLDAKDLDGKHVCNRKGSE